MKKISFKLVILITLLYACKSKDEFVINGKLENLKDLKQVVLYQRDKIVDSAILNEKGEFKFTVISPDPQLYYITARDKNYILLAQNGDELDFKADLANESGEYELTGSKEAESLKELNTLNSTHKKSLDEIQKQYQEQVSQNPAIKDSLEQVLIPRYEAVLVSLAKDVTSFANKNKDNLLGFYAISSLDASKNEQVLLNYAQNLKGKFPNNQDVQGFISKMDKLRAVSAGQVAPDFEMPSPDGTNLKLSNYKGKYVLLDFWASWCAPCREENPNLVKQYNAFKNKGFTILSVSLDDNRDRWLTAIKTDNMNWDHVSELKQWDSKIVNQYLIEALPSSLLLNPEGKIIAKNLRGKELEVFLNQTLK